MLVKIGPVLTSNSAPAGHTATSSTSYGSSFGGGGSYQPFHAFDQNGSTVFVAAQYDITPTLERVRPAAETIDAYSVVGWASSASGAGGVISARAPKSWTYEYHNGTSWVVADTQTNISFTNGEEKVFPITQISAARTRLNISAVNDPVYGGSICHVVSFDEWFENGSVTPPPASDEFASLSIGLTLPRPKAMITTSGSIPVRSLDVPYPEFTDRWQAFYARSTERQISLNHANNRGWVCCVGDSIMERASVQRISPFAEKFAMSSDTAANMGRNYMNLSALSNASMVVDLSGINDITAGKSTSTIIDIKLENYAYITGPLMVIDILPTYNSGWNAAASVINAGVRSGLASRPMTKFVGVSSISTVDGVHPDAAGYETLYAAIQAEL